MDEDEGELCGARCFSRSVRWTRMPRNFKLPSDTPKFDGTQDPKAWLSDHLSSVKLHGGNKETAMQCLQLQLTDAARVWLSSLSSGSIRSWEELAYNFIRNFKGTSKRPASIEELRACTKKRANLFARTYYAGLTPRTPQHTSPKRGPSTPSGTASNAQTSRRNSGASSPKHSTTSWTSPTGGPTTKIAFTEHNRMKR